MDPALAMGAFLRVWRREWAGMTREQLAAGVSAHCSERAITARMVREWEAGQPPHSTEALNGLLDVMRRSHLVEVEVEHFRRSVFDACGARQYPGLYDCEALAQRRDIDELAHAVLYGRRWAHFPNIIYLVAAVAELEDSVAADHGVSTVQRRKQLAALAFMRAALGTALPWTDKPLIAAGVVAVNATFIDTHFGPQGLGSSLSGLSQRICEGLYRAHSGRSEAWAQRLLVMADEALARGQRMLGATAFLHGVHSLADVAPGAYLAHRRRALALHEELDANAHGVHFDIFWAALAEGLTDEAEAHLTRGLSRLTGEAALERYEIALGLGCLAMERGDLSEAQGSFEEALELARESGLAETQALTHIEQCDAPRPKGRKWYREWRGDHEGKGRS